MDSTIEELGKKLILAVDVVMNEGADHQERLRANEFCENFKETSPLCVQCGLYLSTINNTPIVRHIGLQLIEHCIKYRWNNLNLDEKQYIRDNAMKLLASGTGHMLSEPAFIKNGVSKIVVEIIKRQWPQEWPTLLDELHNASNCGETQTELVLLILLRLAEDTVTLQNITSHRRRELHQALTQNLGFVLNFFIQLLFNHTNKFLALQSANDTFHQQSLIHCQMAQAVLETFTAFVEWIPFTHLWSHEGILPSLCSLLTAEKLQLQGAECLLQIVSRKGKVEERKPCLALFTEECMKHIYQAADTASSNPVDERRFTFLKRLCQVLVGIGNQLTVLWGSNAAEVGRPEHFEIYLNAIFAFTCHPSLMLNSLTQSLWSSFLRHEFISQDSILQSFITRIADVSRVKLIRVGSPSRNDHPSCQYSIFDFDSDEDFNAFFSKHRTEITDTLRLATVICPMEMFNLAANWLQQQLVKPSLNEETTINSPLFLDWEALALYLEAICSKIFFTDKPKPSAEQGILLLQSVLRYETNDALILSCALSCISALFIFLTLSSDALPAVLEKLFSAVTFSLPGQTKSNRSRAVKNVRRHACSSLVKICKHHPTLFLSSFDQIHQRLNLLSADPDQLSQMEKCTLYEALILISNKFNNYQQQTTFFENYLIPVKNIWLSQEITYAFSSAETLMHYIGLTHAPINPGDDDVFGNNRSHVNYCVTTILGTLKRTKWPKDVNVAVRGGFFRPYSSDCHNTVLCNPSTPFILPFFDNLFKLIRSLNNLWLPEAKVRLAAEYRRAYDMWDVDKNNVSSLPLSIDVNDSSAVKQPFERMQLFVTSLHDNCYHVLGNAGPTLTHEFYVMPGLSHYIITHILCNIDLIPDYRLRSIIRIFMKPFVQFCPSEFYETTLIPVLIQLCPYMFQRLNNKWMQLNQYNHENNIKDNDENSEVQELLEDQINRLMSREYVELLAIIVHGKRGASTDSTIDAMDEDDHCISLPSNNPTLSYLGQLVLKHGTLCSSIVCCCFRALSWNDSTICNKTLLLCNSLIKHLVSLRSLNGEDAKDLLMCILMGLQQHGQHEANQGALLNVAFQAYESLRPLHPEVSSLLREIPDCPLDLLQSFDNMLLQTTPTKVAAEKKRKEMFKKIVNSIIGKNIGQLFKKPVHIKSLPPLFRPSKPKRPDILSKSVETGALCRLFALNEENNSDI